MSHPARRISPNLSAYVFACGVFALCLGCEASEPGARESALIHGTDDRTEFYDYTGATAPVQATAALMLDSNITVDGDTVTLTETETLGELWHLCQGERFSEQPINAFCSATLIGPDLVLTANRCVRTQAECEETRIVFDYLYLGEGVLADIGPEDVYNCVDRVAADNNSEYVVLRLHEEVQGRLPVNIRYYDVRSCDGGVTLGESVAAYGHPNGIPMKIDEGAVVTVVSRSSGRFFRATFDSFALQDGGGIFNTSGELVGMLEGGVADYEEVGDCYTPVVIDAADAASSEQTATHAVQAMRGFCASNDISEEERTAYCPSEVVACDETGEIGTDAGVAVFPPSTSGCGCRVVGQRAPSGAPGAALFLLLVATRRWRRARS